MVDRVDRVDRADRADRADRLLSISQRYDTLILITRYSSECHFAADAIEACC